MRYRTLDLNLLVVLDALLEHCSVSRAAEQLFVSQPAISAGLARLRQHFGDPLLELDGRRMRPTPLALEMTDKIRHAVRQAGEIARGNLIFEAARTRQSFKVMCSDLDSGFLIPLLYQRLVEQAPEARLEVLSISQLGEGAVQDAFLRHGADVLIVPQDESDPAYASQVLLDVPLATLVSQRPVEPSFVVDPADGCEVIASDFEMKASDGWRTDHLLALPALLSVSNLRVRLPDFIARRFCQRYPNLRMLNAAVQATRWRQVMQWPRHRDQEPAHTWIREQLLDCAAQLVQAPVGTGQSVIQLHPLATEGVTAQHCLDGREPA
ncbi:LysR family transcriptional regulator [Pseudomonas sp. A2]|uniref:LysR family transcriptional regulator n=1 Tax=Pseudomonas sp. A2 TaxID=107445 RepID=UPI002ACC5AE1|nr:LysR family transcriptional regulator [Pseudomonas sp. A2]MEB3440345.1 LysR family transcriptional regulator [Pseudomonas sp. A2]HEN8736045.1 LysR family transcriptional regulator [Pseudomonas putida]